MKKRIPLLFGFLGFAVCIALRDVSYRFIFMGGVSAGVVMISSGAIAFGLAVLYALVKRQTFALRNLPLQGLRLLLSVLAGFSIIKTFEFVAPSQIAIFTKAALPLLIVSGPLFGHKFTGRERIFAVLILAVLGLFALLLPSGEVSAQGYFFLASSIGLTMIEFLFLASAVKNESPFYLSSTPSLGLTIAGVLLLSLSGKDGGEVFSALPEISVSLFLLLMACGVLYFLAYLTSSIRYKVLPPGLAEFPSLLTYFLILPGEFVFWKKVPSIEVFGAAVMTLLLVGALVIARTSQANDQSKVC